MFANKTEHCSLLQKLFATDRSDRRTARVETQVSFRNKGPLFEFVPRCPALSDRNERAFNATWQATDFSAHTRARHGVWMQLAECLTRGAPLLAVKTGCVLRAERLGTAHLQDQDVSDLTAAEPAWIATETSSSTGPLSLTCGERIGRVAVLSRVLAAPVKLPRSGTERATNRATDAVNCMAA